MDEYRKDNLEFGCLNDEFNEHIKYSKKKIDNKKTKRKRKNIIKALSSSALVLTVVPVSISGAQNLEETNKEEIIQIENINDLTNGENDILNEETINEETNNIEVTDTIEEYIYVVCDDCKGLGIICPGDPDFGYDRGNGVGFEGCHGEGYTICPDIWCHEGIKTCQSCNGSGKEKNDICEVCDGKGIVDCEFCHNTGIAECITIDSHYTCLKCNGEGQIKVLKEDKGD